MADYAAYYALTKRTMYELVCKHRGGWNPADCRNGFDVETVSNIMVDGVRVGFLNVKDKGDYLHIENIQLYARYRNKGIGQQVLEELLSRNTDRTFRLMVFEGNPAVKLYEKLGFKADGQKYGSIIMSKSPAK